MIVACKSSFPVVLPFQPVTQNTTLGLLGHEKKNILAKQPLLTSEAEAWNLYGVFVGLVEDFHGNLWLNYSSFVAFFSCLFAGWIIFILVWFEDLFPLHKLEGNVVLDRQLKLMTSEAAQGTGSTPG